MRNRILAVSLPFMCVATAVLLVLAIPFALAAMIVMLVKPSIVLSIQERMQRKIVKATFAQMNRKAHAHAKNNDRLNGSQRASSASENAGRRHSRHLRDRQQHGSLV